MKKNSWIICNKNKILSFVVLFIICFIWIWPLLWVVNGSLKSSTEWSIHPSSFFPTEGYTIDNFISLFFGKDQANGWDYSAEAQPVLQWVFNSLFVSILHTVLYLLIGSFAAFAFTFLEFKGRNVLFYLLLASQVIPGVVLITPQFSMIVEMGMSLSLWALILPGLGSIAGIFLMRQFFMGIPKEIVESARVDGANIFLIYLKMICPLAKSVFLVQGLFCFIGSWNDYAWAQVVLGYGPSEGWTLQLGLTHLVDMNKGQLGATGVTLAAAVVSMIPVFLVYLFAQNRIVEGVAMSGLKQ